MHNAVKSRAKLAWTSVKNAMHGPANAAKAVIRPQNGSAASNVTPPSSNQDVEINKAYYS